MAYSFYQPGPSSFNPQSYAPGSPIPGASPPYTSNPSQLQLGGRLGFLLQNFRQNRPRLLTRQNEQGQQFGALGYPLLPKEGYSVQAQPGAAPSQSQPQEIQQQARAASGSPGPSKSMNPWTQSQYGGFPSMGQMGQMGQVNMGFPGMNPFGGWMPPSMSNAGFGGLQPSVMAFLAMLSQARNPQNMGPTGRPRYK